MNALFDQTRELSSGVVVADLIARTLAALNSKPMKDQLEILSRDLDVSKYELWAMAVYWATQENFHVFRKGNIEASRDFMSDDSMQFINRIDRVADHFFISYRRADSPKIAKHVFDALAGLVGKNSVFFDTSSMPLGTKFREEIQRRIEMCRGVLLIVGEDWDEVSPSGIRRLEEISDPIRIELMAAEKYNRPCIVVETDPSTLDNAVKEYQFCANLNIIERINLGDCPSLDEFLDRIGESAASMPWIQDEAERLRFDGLTRDDLISVSNLLEVSNRFYDLSLKVKDCVGDSERTAELLQEIGNEWRCLADWENLLGLKEIDYSEYGPLGLQGETVKGIWARVFEAVFEMEDEDFDNMGNSLTEMTETGGTSELSRESAAAASAYEITTQMFGFLRKGKSHNTLPKTFEGMCDALETMHRTEFTRVGVYSDSDFTFGDHARFNHLFRKCIGEESVRDYPEFRALAW